MYYNWAPLLWGLGIILTIGAVIGIGFVWFWLSDGDGWGLLGFITTMILIGCAVMGFFT